MEALSQTPHLYDEIQPHLCAIMDVLFLPEKEDDLDDLSEMLIYLTFYVPKINEQMWKYFDSIYFVICGNSDSGHGWAQEYLEQFLCPLDNYMSRDSEVFLIDSPTTGIPRKQMILNMARSVIESQVSPKSGLELLFLMFEGFYNKSGIDDMMLPTLQLQLQFVQATEAAGSKVEAGCRGMLLRGWAAMFLYNSSLFLELLNSTTPCLTEVVFDFWLKHLNCVQRPEGRKAILLCFSKLIHFYSSSTLPPAIVSKMPSIVEQASQQASRLLSNEEAEKNESNDSDWESQDGDSEQELEEYEDAKNPTCQRFLDKIAALTANDEDDDSDDLESLDGAADDALRSCPMDEVDAVQVLKTTLAAIPVEIQSQVAAWFGQEAFCRLVA